MRFALGLLLAFSVAIVGCVHSHSPLRHDSILAPYAPIGAEWFYPESKLQTNAVAVLIHGLNMNPQKFADVAQLLNRKGVTVLRAALSGHRGKFEEFKNVTRDIWLADVYQAYHAARLVADEKHVPLYFVGYSLGALLNADLMTLYGNEKIKYDKIVLFAPALTTRWYTRMVLALWSGFVLPSGAPPGYEINSGTPMAAFEALFQAKAAVREAQFKNLNLPTLVFIDKNDELISYRSLENAIKNFGLDNWHIEYVDNTKGTVLPRYHHMILDQRSCGSEEWARISDKTIEFLRVN